MDNLNCGDKIDYYGSIEAARGEGTYFGPCHCEDCMYRYYTGRPVTRHHLLTPAGPITHVRTASFIPV
jgi:hypothetical protein